LVYNTPQTLVVL